MPNCRFVCYLWISVIILPAVVGCGRAGVGPPPVDPEAATDAAIAQLDKDGDGSLDRTELEGSPALLAAQAEYDTTGDKKTDREELLLRINDMYTANVGLTNARCTVTLDGKPLQGATISYIPEAFLGEGTTKKATGVTNKSGTANMSIPKEDMPEEFRQNPMMQVGLYHVEITHPTKEIPAKYNTASILGFEIHPYAHDGQDATFRLKSK